MVICTNIPTKSIQSTDDTPTNTDPMKAAITPTKDDQKSPATLLNSGSANSVTIPLRRVLNAKKYPIPVF